MKHRFLGAVMCSILIISGFLGQLTSVTYAQAYRGLIIDEFRFTIENAKPGDVYTRTFNVIHDFSQKDKVVTLYLRSADFTSDGITGTPKFLPSGYLSPQASLSSWITFDKPSVTLDHYGQKEEVKFTIKVPNDTEPGGKYAAVLLSDQEGGGAIDPNDEKTQLGINKELGPLVLLTVGGNTTSGIKANSFFTTNLDGKSRLFYFNPPINLVTEIANIGNTHTIPRGVFYIYRGSDFQKNIAKLEMNDKEGYILPNSTRQFSATWDESFLSFYKERQKDGKFKTRTRYNWDKLSKLRIGKYNVKLLYNTQGGDGTNVTMEMYTYFWLFPWQLIVLIIILLVYLYFKFRKQRNNTESRRRTKQVAQTEVK